MDLEGKPPARPRNAKSGPHFENFINAVRSRNFLELNCDVEEGHRSTVLPHLANISYRLGREVQFDSHSEHFVNDEQANGYLSRKYRHPYVVPKEV